VMAGMQATADSFALRPLGENPVFLRRLPGTGRGLVQVGDATALPADGPD
jgi:hypothetical protein